MKRLIHFLIIIGFIGFQACHPVPITSMKLIAGNGSAGFVNGKPAEFNKPIRLAPYNDSMVLVADIYNHAIRMVTLKGEVSTIVGGPHLKGFQDGPADVAKIEFPHGVAYDNKTDRIYFVEASSHVIRMITKEPNGGNLVSTIAGIPGQDGFQDGPVDSAKFSSPHAVAICQDGGIVIADIGNARLRKIKDGKVSTIAGSGESGIQDGQPKQASFQYIMDIVVEGKTIYAADAGSHSIRKIVPGQGVSTLSLKDTLSTPHGITIDNSQNLYVADMGSHRILKIDEQGLVSTVAGTGKLGSQLHELNKPAAVLVHNDHLWIADLNNHQIKTILLENLSSVKANH